MRAGGRIEFLVESGSCAGSGDPDSRAGGGDQGPRRPFYEGLYVSPTGLGLGIIGAKRLMDRFTIDSTPGAGATVLMAKSLPHRHTPSRPRSSGDISAELARHAPQGLLEELQKQNQELLNALEELRHSQSEIAADA